MIQNNDDLVKTIFEKAEADDINPAIVAVRNGVAVGHEAFWWGPEIDENDNQDVYHESLNLLAGYDDILTQMAQTVAHTIQFPVNSIFMHMLGVISATMTEHFTYSFGRRGGQAVGIYVVSAQPPSSGKSGANSILTEAAHHAYREINERNVPIRRKLTRKINSIQKKSEKVPAIEAEHMEDEVIELEKELARHPIYSWALTDPTPEGCEKMLGQHGGFFNIITAESSTVRVVLGTAYSDRPSNNGVFLSSWDNEYIAVARGGRDGFCGYARASIAILAQDASVQEILKAGLGGEGISERFMIVREPSLLGKRDHSEARWVDEEIKARYDKMIDNIVNSRYDVELTLSKPAILIINECKKDLEKTMGLGGKYSSPMMRGVVGKCDKQIARLACIMHVANAWADGGERSLEVGGDYAMRAVLIFNQLLKTYVSAADSNGFSGKKTEEEVIISALSKMAQKKRLSVSVRSIRDAIKNTKPMDTIENLTKKMREEYLPGLEKRSFLVFKAEEDLIYINPRLK